MSALYTLSLHDALPICVGTGLKSPAHCCDRTRMALREGGSGKPRGLWMLRVLTSLEGGVGSGRSWARRDRKSTRLNSSHVAISYAVFCFNKNSTRTSTD